MSLSPARPDDLFAPPPRPSSNRALRLLCVGAVAFIGCRAGRVPDDEVVYLIEAPPKTLDPRFAVSSYDFKLSRLVYAPLVSVDDPDLLPKMELAESVTARSATEYLVTLREGARFSDGRRVTADDVVYTLDSIRKEGSLSRLKLRFQDDGLQRMEVLDDRHLRFVLSHSHAPFVTDLDVGILARPAPGQQAGAPIGAGAFVLVSSEHERYRFRPNPYYVAGAPPIRALTVKVIRDENARMVALLGGSGDLTQNTVAQTLLPAVARQPGIRIESGRSSVYTYLGMRNDDPVLADARVRRAIAFAIDRERIVRARFGGRAVLSSGMLPPFHWAYASDTARYDYDPAHARALLDEAGHPDPDGAGPQPRFTLLYKTSSARFRVGLAQIIAAQLADVGIAVEVQPLEPATFMADLKAGNFQLYTLQTAEISEPDIYTNFFDSRRIPTRENPDLGANRMRYRNPELDRLLEKGRAELDVPARIADYREVQRILARDVPVISLWHEDNVVVMQDRITGYQILPTASITSLARTFKLPRPR